MFLNYFCIIMKAWMSKMQEAEDFWVIIKNFTQEEKFCLISKLSESLLGNDPDLNKNNMDDKKYTEVFLQRFAGKWNSNLSAEELVDIIGEKRSCKDPISL